MPVHQKVLEEIWYKFIWCYVIWTGCERKSDKFDIELRLLTLSDTIYVFHSFFLWYSLG